MDTETWYVTIDGTQLSGEHETARVRDLVARNEGKQMLVWKTGMSDWADPLTLPEFKPAAPSPAPSPVAAQPRRPAAAVAAPAAATPAPAPVRAPASASPSARGASPRMAVPVSAEELQEQAGVFKALFDTSFNTLLTPKLVKAIYILFMVLLALGGVGLVGTALLTLTRSFVAGIGALLIAVVVFPAIAMLYLAILRMSLEVIMAIFKIKEYTGILAERARREEAGKD